MGRRERIGLIMGLRVRRCRFRQGVACRRLGGGGCWGGGEQTSRV
jgi:hypothetical protein